MTEPDRRADGATTGVPLVRGTEPELRDELLRSGTTAVEERVESGELGLRAVPASIAGLGRTLALLRAHKLKVRVAGANDGPLPPPPGGAIVDLVKLDKILLVDPKTCTARVEAGCAVAAVEAAALRAGMTLGAMLPHLRSGSVGAWLGGPTRGMRAVAGSRRERVSLSLAVVLPDGRIAEGRAASRSGMGPDLQFLSLGGAGRLSVIAAATLRFFPAGEVSVAEWSVSSMATAVAVIERLALKRLCPLRARAVALPDGKIRLAATWEGPRTARLERDRALRLLRAQGLAPEPATADAATWVRSPSGPDAIEADARWSSLREFAGLAGAGAPGTVIRLIGPWAGGSFAVLSCAGLDADACAARARSSGTRVISPRRLRDVGVGWADMGAGAAWTRLVAALGAEEG